MSGIEFMNGMMGNISNSINTCILGKINSFDGQQMKATVEPLINSEEGKSLLIEVPVAFIKTEKFFIRPPYQVGDVVLVVFADEDIDNAILNGDVASAATDRKHSLDDGIVIGGILPFNSTLEGEFEDTDLVIQGDGNSIILKEDGDIEIKGKKISIDGSEGVTISGPTHSESW